MKNVKKAFLGFTLGASLCAGLLVAAPKAAFADIVWSCPGGGQPTKFFVVCADPIFVNGVRYRNVGVWCNNTNPPASLCYYQQG